MKILLADDAEVVRLMIGRFVESLGHELLLASDGVEAVERCVAFQPDMVLMDMLMPRMDGPEAGREIKIRMGERWVPIILVTAVEEVGKLADAMEIGADDYLLKPVNFRILEAKIKAIERTVALNRKVREQSAKLAEYYDRAEEEKRVARHLMEQLVSHERLSDPQLHYWIAPAESLSGDLVAAARTPGQVMHLMLADGIGHGLTAALNVLPLTQPFYAMTERGFTLTDILTEMHRKVRQVLPTGRFVALAFVAVDFVNCRIEVWNGGIPELRLFDEQGGLLKRWPSRHLPLGILPVDALDLETERHTFQGRGNLVLCSDGLLEARNDAGEAFGLSRLALACAGWPAEEALDRTITSLSDFLAGAHCHDDVSLAIVDIDPAAVRPLPEPTGLERVPQMPSEARWRYSMSLGPDELRSLHTVPLIMGFVNQVRPLANHHADIFLILTELFVNALDHGLLQLSSSLKRDADGMEQYLLERSLRLAALREGRIEVELAGYDLAGRTMLVVRVSDSGQGFDSAWLGAPDVRRPSGRGITLVRALCASLHYFGNGNTVEACYLPRDAS
ncbi:ATP-binding SpoIIE family protein phosphatase [Chitinimonas koreensis]|uniref:ATP-binding SpoIIE family protein phosphatase n=1 Tax=Chitinimonas koreensis TaxID=356302 RepID=UPI00041C5F4C|nr:fused response regulator/phosphatase [Chitinimonas koreensis]QNM98282.1 fused response regulator/phosphatase [Chitinimonas koreensis]